PRVSWAALPGSSAEGANPSTGHVRAARRGPTVDRCTIKKMAATILIVEDEFAVARGIQYALQQEGYQVAMARSGEEGLDIAVNQAPDLVVLDVRLPGMDGLEVLR